MKLSFAGKGSTKARSCIGYDAFFCGFVLRRRAHGAPREAILAALRRPRWGRVQKNETSVRPPQKEKGRAGRWARMEAEVMERAASESVEAGLSIEDYRMLERELCW